MKRLFTILSISILFFSCEKKLEFPSNERNKTLLLTSTAWQVEHIRVVQTNGDYYYKRGGQNNTYDYSNDLLKFDQDGSGTYSAGNDHYQISWRFDSDEKTEMTYTIHNYADGHPQNGIDHVVKLENVYIAVNRFRYSELYTNHNGTHSAASVYRESTAHIGH